MGRGDLENRDAEHGLGELPEEIADESGMLAPYSQSAALPHAPADVLIADASQQAEKTTGLGSPQLDFTVRSVYDSRPTSGYDFNVYASAAIAEETMILPPTDFFTVPPGFVGVLRGFEAWITNSTGEPFVLRNQYLISALIAGTRALNNSDVAMGQAEDFDTFLIADEFQAFGFSGAPGATAPLILTLGVTPLLHVVLYGNLLLKTGVPAMFQIANLADSKGPAQVVDAREIPGQMPGAAIDAETAMREAGMVTRPRRRPRNPYRGVPLLKR